MASHHHSSDHDTLGPVDTAAADHPPPPPARWQHDDTSVAPRIRLMCSFGGRILPRPHDNQLRYVGGDTRIVAVHRNCTFSTILSKLAKFTSTTDTTIKYQLPNEELDALISITSDEDVENMMEEYDRLLGHGSSADSRSPRLRLFLFPSDVDGGGFGSILSGTGASKHEHWFLDALNGGRPLERGRSEASSILSEVPDYLFGLDNNSDEPIKPKTSVFVSDPGSPAPVVSSPHYGSASSASSIPITQNVAQVEINPAESELNQQGAGYVPQTVWQYMPEPVPVYYMTGPVQSGNLPVRPAAMPMPYVQPMQQVARGQIPVGYRPMYVGGAGAYDYPVGPTSAGTNPGAIPMYRPTMGVPPPGTGESPAISSSDTRIVRAPNVFHN